LNYDTADVGKILLPKLLRQSAIWVEHQHEVVEKIVVSVGEQDKLLWYRFGDGDGGAVALLFASLEACN
jgi:hypothetical protein